MRKREKKCLLHCMWVCLCVCFLLLILLFQNTYNSIVNFSFLSFFIHFLLLKWAKILKSSHQMKKKNEWNEKNLLHNFHAQSWFFSFFFLVCPCIEFLFLIYFHLIYNRNSYLLREYIQHFNFLINLFYPIKKNHSYVSPQSNLFCHVHPHNCSLHPTFRIDEYIDYLVLSFHTYIHLIYFIYK